MSGNTPPPYTPDWGQPPKSAPSWGQQPLPPGWGQPPAGPPPKEPMSKRTKIIVGVVGGLFILGAIGSLAKTSATATAAPAPTVTKTVTATPAAPAPAVTVTVTAAPAPAPTVTVTVTVTAAAPQPAPAPAPAGDTFKGDGTYLVGTDIKPGTYKTAGPGDAGMCYWERNSSADGGLGSIIANDNLNGQGVVTIKSSDKVFKSTGCQDWTKVG